VGRVSSTYLGIVVENKPVEMPNNTLPMIIVSNVNIIVIPVPINPIIILTNYARLLPIDNNLPPIKLPIIIPAKSDDPIILSFKSAF